MPWKVGQKTNKGWQILKKVKTGWRVVGHSDSREKARRSVRARYNAVEEKLKKEP